MPTPAPLPRLVTSCQRGTEDSRPILYLPHSPAAKSVLELTLAPGVTCQVPLSPRYTRFLLIVVDAWREDEGEIDMLRGFRTTAEIGRRLSNPSNTVPVSDRAVQAYVFEIKYQIRRAVSMLRLHDRRDLRVPVLIESRRMLGYRIGPCGLEIVQPRPRPVITD